MAQIKHRTDRRTVILLGLLIIVIAALTKLGFDTTATHGRQYTENTSKSESGTGIKNRDYYIDRDHPQAQDSSRHGGIDKPWKTLKYALGQLGPGDTLFIRGGTYENETITLDEHNSGQQGAFITVQAFPGETVVLENGGSLRFYGANWWIIDGLRFVCSQGAAIRLGQHQAMGHDETVAAEHITIRNCEFGEGDKPALTLFYGSHILIENNYFHHLRPGEPFEQVGLETTAVNVRYIGDCIEIRGNRFEDIGSDGVHLGSHHYVSGSDIGSVEITDNEFWVNRPYGGILGNVGENGIDVKAVRGPIVIAGNSIHGFRPTTPEQDASGANGDGVIVHHNARNITIAENRFYDNTKHLNIIESDGGRPENITICNNTFQKSSPNDNRGYTVEGAALSLRSADNIQVYHNYFSDNYRFLIVNGVTGSVFKNNVVVGGKVTVCGDNARWEADFNVWSGLAEPIPTILQGAHDVSANDYRPGSDPWTPK